MNDERGEIAVKLRVGVFVLVALAAFLGMGYALGARARLFEAHYTIHAEFTEVAGLTEGATVRLAGVQIGRVTDVHLPGEPGGKVRVDLTIARRYADRIRRDSIARIETQGLLGDKVVEVTVGTAAAPPLQPGDVLLSPTGTDAARRFVGALDRIGRLVDRPGADQGLLPALLFEPKYKETLEDLRTVTRNLRDVSDRIAGGRGALGSLIADGDAGGLRQIVQDLRVTVANLKEISEKVKEGEGTIGALLADPTIYERLVTILEGAQRSFLLRSLIRGLGEKGAESKGDGPRR